MTHKIAIVTGAGSGIGRAVSKALLKEGYAVALCGRRIEQLNETASARTRDRRRRRVIPTDVTKPESVARLFAPGAR